jgi:hypothetical protein
MSVVEIAMSRTTTNFESVAPLNAATATTMKAVATIPDRTFTRTGVPKLALNFPKKPGKPPSYAATARMRSEPIIHTTPDVSSVPTKHRVMTPSRNCCAPP